jgi:PEP-CTERM motif
LKRHVLRVLTVLACAMGSAQATPNISISYLQPTGTVNIDTPIEVWVQVNTDREISDDFGAPFGFDPSDLPRTTMVTDWFSDVPREAEFRTYTGLGLFRGYTCTPTCDVPGYTFSGVGHDRADGYSHWLGEVLRPGNFLLGTYVPDGTQVTGNITFTALPVLAFRLYGSSTTGENLVSYIGPQGGFTPCNSPGSSGCSFTRNVTAVPEPTAWSMLLIGLGAMGVRQAAYRLKKAAN